MRKISLPKISIPRPGKRHYRTPRLNFSSIHPVFVPVATFVALLVLTLAGYVIFTHNHVAATNSRVVILSHDHMQQTVPSREQSVGALIQKLHIPINEGDVVEPSLDTQIVQDDFRINIYRAVPVRVVDGDQSTFTFSAATTPRSIAKQTGTVVYPEDTVKTEPTTNFLSDGAIGKRVVIDRATPINVNLYGNQVVMRTHAKTVDALLREKNIHLAQGDTVTPAQTQPIAADQQIIIARKGEKIAVENHDIPMPVQTIADTSLAYGTTAIRQQGSPGKRVVTYKINLNNGIEVSRVPIQDIVVVQPVTQIVVVGANLAGIKGDMALAGISPSDYAYADYIISHESGWCPTKWQGEYGGCPAYHGAPSGYIGYGLCQATPGSKMSTAGADWATNPITQLRWCSGYAQRYGGWYGAYVHWQNNGNW